MLAHETAAAKIVRHFKEDIYQLQIGLPLRIDGVIAVDRTEDVARDCTGGVAVAVVVYGRNDTGRKIVLVAQRTVERYRKRFLRYPAAAQALDVVSIRIMVCSQLHRLVDNGAQVVNKVRSVKQTPGRLLRLVDDLQKGHLLFARENYPVQNVRHDRRRHIAQRMPMRDRRQVCALFIELLDRHACVINPQRRSPHDAAAAFAVVPGVFYVVAGAAASARSG